MANNFSSVACAEVHGTARENKTLDDWTATVDLRCAWSDRHALMDDILGNQRAWPYWPYPGGLGLYPKNAAVRPEASEYSQSGQGMDYVNAIATVNYQLPGKDGQPDATDPSGELYSESFEPTTEFMTLEYSNYEWKSDGVQLKEGEEPGKLIRGLRLVRTIFSLDSINANILSLPGSVNSTSYTSLLLGLTFPEETLLFIPPQISRTVTTDGAGAWNVRLGWEFKEQGWNKFWREKTGTYDTIVVSETGADAVVYESKNQNPWLP